MQLRSDTRGRFSHEGFGGATSRIWTVEALNRISGTDDEGARVVVPPGRYLMREIDDITYELHDSTASPLLRLRVSEVAAHVNHHSLVIDGLWP